MNWLSIHFYPNETQDHFLTRALKPFLEQYIWSQKDARAFFIRYQDEKGPHIRLRIRGEEEWLQDMIRPAVEGWFQGRGEWMEVPYVRETDRFGGEEAMTWAEEHFHLSTRVVLDRISRDQFIYGDAMFDALRLLAIMAFGAEFTPDKARWYFDQLLEQWLPLFFPVDDAAVVAEIKESFDQTFSAQKVSLVEAIIELWTSLEAEKFDDNQPEWLRWLRGNQLIFKGLGDNLAQALPSLIHLNNNRIGINNQDEVYLNYILSKSF